MPFRKSWRLLAAIAAAAAAPCLAAADQVKADIAARLGRQVGEVAPAQFVHGSGAFDADIRAQVDDHANAGAAAIEQGRKLWTRKFAKGRSLAACFPNGGRRIAATYPHYDSRLKRVVTLEMAINQCLKSHGQPLYEPADPQTMGAVTAYVRSLANGQKVKVRVPAAAEPRFEEGRRLYFSRMGQRNYACASCHVQGAGKRFDERPLSPAIGQATHWPVIRDGIPVTLQTRIRECLELMGAAPFPAGSDELNHLEYFLTYLSNGLPMKANVWRPSVIPAQASVIPAQAAIPPGPRQR